MSTNEIVFVNHLDSQEVQMYMQVRKDIQTSVNVSGQLDSDSGSVIVGLACLYFLYKILSGR